MPAGTRIRGNNAFGTVNDNPLTAGAMVLNSSQLPLLPPVAGGHAVITLDPIRQFGEPEIILVVSHSSMATVASITRAAYGTVARSHPQGTTWVHTPIDEDYIEVLTSVTRPSNPYEGQLIFETDTNKLVGYGGVDWAPRDAGGQLGYAQITSNFGPFTAETDITGLSVTVNVGTGRRIKITGWLLAFAAASGNGANIRIREDVTQLQNCSQRNPAANETNCYVPVWIGTPSAGTHTYKLTMTNAGGAAVTIVAAPTVPAFILVEDIGAA